MGLLVEKRRHRRRPLSMPATVRYQGRLIPAIALNVSSGGICVLTENPQIVANNPVEVCLDLDDKNRDVSLRGDIVRVYDNGENNSKREYSVGIRFTNLFSKGHDALQSYLRFNL